MYNPLQMGLSLLEGIDPQIYNTILYFLKPCNVGLVIKGLKQNFLLGQYQFDGADYTVLFPYDPMQYSMVISKLKKYDMGYTI